MARPIWKGHISFGLVNIPVTLYSAESNVDLHFKLVDGRNHGAIRYERINEITGEEVPWNEIVKGYEHEDGEFVLLSEEDFKRAAPEATQTIEIAGFVPDGAIGAEYYDKPYFLVPAKKGERSYALLRETLKLAQKTGVATVVIRSRQYLAAVIVRNRALVLELLRFQQELKEAPEDKLPSADISELKIADKEIALARQLVDAMSTDWNPADYKDEYRDSLKAWIDQKVAKGETAPVAAAEEESKEGGAEVIDMMTLLKRSMEAKAKARPEPKPASAKKERRGKSA